MFKKKEGVPEGLYMWSFFIIYPGLLYYVFCAVNDIFFLSELWAIMGRSYHGI